MNDLGYMMENNFLQKDLWLVTSHVCVPTKVPQPSTSSPTKENNLWVNSHHENFQSLNKTLHDLRNCSVVKGNYRDATSPITTVLYISIKRKSVNKN